MAQKITIPNVRFSYAHVFQPYAFEGDTKEPKYSVTILIPKKGANGKVIIPQQPAKQQHQQSAKQQHQQSAKQQHQQPAKSKEKAKTNDTVQPKKRRR